jgi:hypothetical protein
VAVPVVDALEAVEVDEQDGRRPRLPAARVGVLLVGGAVRDAGQEVGEGELRNRARRPP